MHDVSERQPASAGRSKSAHDERTLVQRATDAIFTLDAEGTLTSLNPAFEAITGWSRDDWIGKAFPGIVHPDDLPLAVELFTHAMAGGGVPLFELRILTNSGGYVDGEFTASPLLEDGRVVGILGIGRDVSARKRVESDLERRGAILEAVAFAAERFLGSGSWEDSIAEVLERIGRAASVDWVCLFQKAVGDDGDVQRNLRFEWVAPGTSPKADLPFLRGSSYAGSGLDRWARTFRTGGTINGRVSELPAEERPILQALGFGSVAGVPVYVGGEWWGTLGFAARAQDRDFSGTEIDALRTGARLLGAAIQEERTESALRRSEDRYHKAVDTSPDAILVHQNGVIALANQAAARLLVVPSPNPLVGNSVLRFVHSDSRPLVFLCLQRLPEGITVWPVD